MGQGSDVSESKAHETVLLGLRLRRIASANPVLPCTRLVALKIPKTSPTNL